MLLAAIIVTVSAVLIPQAVTAIEGEKIDAAPKDWPSSWRKQYRILLYSETHGSKTDKVIQGYKSLLVEILRAEGIDVDDSNVFAIPPMAFPGKSDQWISAVAHLFTRCADILATLNQSTNALDLYKKSLAIYSGLDKHASLAYTGIARIYTDQGDLKLAEKYRKLAVIAACDKRTLSNLDVGAAEDGLKVVDDLAVARIGSDPTDVFVDAATELGLIYVQNRECAKALRIFLSLVRLIAEKKDSYQTHQQKYPHYTPQLADEARLKYYISETLWALGFPHEALEWTHMAYDEAVMFYMKDNAAVEIARISMQNLAKMYKHFGKEEEAEASALQASRINLDPSKNKFLWVIGHRL
ncbi:hypothetical protein V1525DRAFT_335987 [Lipomyces kononenkoae]|uniref:Uncharacterized protein n=1 Tax=Lipomyces kononenkoae TaxID=34357 RepID=A0ACC3TBA9_LIPKO